MPIVSTGWPRHASSSSRAPQAQDLACSVSQAREARHVAAPRERRACGQTAQGISCLGGVLAGAAPAGARPLMGVSRILGGPDDVIWEQDWV